MQREDFDSPWKEILGLYFEHFMRFFFPDIASEIDWEKGYEISDKELRQITREAETGKRLADMLFRVWKKDGEETWVMAHVEVQARRETDFPDRTYTYNYRIRDLYKRAAVSLAVLADENPKWRPSGYFQKLWGCVTFFRFRCVKILDYRDRLNELEESDNPFAVVAAAHLKTLETKGDDSSRRRWKAELTKSLYRRGFEKQDILNLYRFIDWIMALPEDMEREYHREITEFEEEQKMQYITTAERIGIEKGERIGIEKGERIGIEKGRKEGEFKRARETARNLLAMGALTAEQIARATGLSIKEIEELQK